MTFMKFTLLIFIGFIAYAHAAVNPCSEIPLGDHIIDLTDLAEEYAQFEVPLQVGNRFLFNLCKNIPQECEGSSKAIEVFSAGECYKMAGDGLSDITFEKVDDFSTIMTYSGGAQFHEQYVLASEITLVCDETATPFTTKYLGEKEAGHLMITMVELRSSRICPRDGRPFLWPVGLFGLLLIFIIISIIVYFVVGFIMQFIRKKKGAEISGLEYIPNFKLWRELVLLERDGFLFTKELIVMAFEKVRGLVRRRGYTEQY